MTSTLANIQTDKTLIKNQLGDIPDVVTVPKFFSSDLSTKCVVTKYTVKNVSGSMIWGSPSYGVWGVDDWGSVSGSAFILNSSSFGVLGTNRLGSSGVSESLYAVMVNNNVYYEYFGQENYINTTNSTGTINTTLETYTLAVGEILESEIICKPRGAINKVHLFDNNDFTDAGTGMILPFTLGVSEFGDDNVIVEISNDAGVTWFGINEATDYTFTTTTSDDELKYRITNITSSTITIENPLVIKIN